MKTSTIISFTILMTFTMLLSCSKPDFTGTWRNQYREISICKEGNIYLIKKKFGDKNLHNGSYENGQIKTEFAGTIIYIDKKGTILWNNVEYEKISENEDCM